MEEKQEKKSLTSKIFIVLVGTITLLASIATIVGYTARDFLRDPKEKIVQLGLEWNYHDFAQAIANKQTDAVELYAKGGMKLMKEDFINYFTNFYDERITQILIDCNSIDSECCPFDYMVDFDFYNDVPINSSKGKQISEICNCSENYEKIESLIAREKDKVQTFSALLVDDLKHAECIKDFGLKPNFNSDELVYDLYDEAAKFDMFSMPIYNSPKARVLSKLNTFLLTKGVGGKDEPIIFLRDVIKNECPELYILIEADDLYLQKLQDAKSLIFHR